jgi:dynein heavy chain, axonemal
MHNQPHQLLRSAGTGSSDMVFLFSDNQIKNQAMVEDINNMLNSGEVPNIFPADERAAICDAVRGFAKTEYGKIAADMTVIYKHFFIFFSFFLIHKNV